ncbi:oligopeptide/dipeptide ABC transporter ATP-binding protein [Siccirubricoccus deserti]
MTSALSPASPTGSASCTPGRWWRAPHRRALRRAVAPYTRGLLACVPVPGKVKREEALGSIPGMVPRIPPGFTGCAFRDRCDHAAPECAGAVPRQQAGAHEVLCRLPPGWAA